jgi:non-specific serine/threonine protein kinase
MEITLDEIYQINQNIFNSQYKYISTLAKGSFGTVIKSLDLKTNKQVAVKIISKLNDAQEAINQLKKEVSVLKKTNLNNIVKLYDFYETSSEIYIIMEYIKGGTLKTYMKKNKENLNENTTKKIIFYLLNAINYLHKLKIIHSDIKPENIMFENEEDISTLKLIDFGLSSFNNKENEYCGTFLYMAPEILFNNKKLLTNEIDIWSVGIIMYQLLNKNIHPFFNKFELKKNNHKKDFLENLKNYEKSNKLIFHNENYISRKAKNLLFNLLQIKSKNRIQSNLALNHIWFDDLNIKNYYLLDLNKKIFSEDDLKIINKGKKIFLTLIFLNQIKNHFFIKNENKNKSYSESTNNTEENSVLINNLKNVNFFIKKNKKIYKNINLKDKKIEIKSKNILIKIILITLKNLIIINQINYYQLIINIKIIIIIIKIIFRI